MRRYRLAAGLTQEALAERARVSVQGVSALERGLRTTPQRETLNLLADALALEPNDRAVFTSSILRVARPRNRNPDAFAHGKLPAAFSSLHGRAQDIAEVASAVVDQRLTTLTGTGGIGKTRIAIEAARAAGSTFGDGVCFVELGAIREGRLVAHRTLQALGAPVDASDLVAAVVAALRARHTLIVFDTCEHVLGDVAELAAAILERASDVHMLVTSRQPIGIAGEIVRQVRSLPPDAAVELFAARALAANDAFRLTDANRADVETICRHVDALPLAIELVAPKTTMLSAAQIASMLRDRLPLLQTLLRAVFDWSFDLLDDRERILFRRLGLFADGWTLARCQAVCGDAALSAWDVVETLGRLVGKSLVVADERAGATAFRLLESTRAYAAEILERSGEANLLYERLATVLVVDVADLRSFWDDMDDGTWQRAITAERETIRAVMARPAANDDAAAVLLTLLVAIPDPGLVFERREIRRWYERASALAQCVSDLHLTAAYARGVATLSALDRAPVETICAHARAAVDASRAALAPSGMIEALRLYGNALRQAGRLDEAEAAFNEGWPLIDQAKPAAKAAFLSDWAMRDLRAGAVDSAQARLERCLIMARPGGIIHANTLTTLGECAFLVDDVAAARSFSSRAIVAFRSLDLGMYLAVACCNAAAYAIADDDADAALEAVAEALDVLRGIGIAYYVAVALEHVAVLAALRDDDDTALPIFAFVQAALNAAGAEREQTEQRGYKRAMAHLAGRLGPARLSQRLADCAHVDERRALELAHLSLRMETR